MTRRHGSSSFASAARAGLLFVLSAGLACDRGAKPGAVSTAGTAGTAASTGSARATGAQGKTLPAGTPATNPSLPGISGSPELDAKLARALASKGADYAPRTRHLHPDGRPKFTNRLIEQTSPYLLQHAHNPVNWRPWSDEAFQAALAQDKPVLLSIGYSTCHWCHVMERESFEDEEIAAFINANYIAIKVDREERPDVDEVYMDAVRSLNGGRGGWPMTLLLTAERQPFFGGTYLPPRDNARGRRPGFLTVLQQHAEQYRNAQGDMVERARQVSERIAAQSVPRPGKRPPGPAVIRGTVQQLLARHDAQWGGFGEAPKFPRPANLELLTRWIHRTGDPQALAALTKTLDKMIDGGMHDHVGGGFHRYATDARWLVPHFEKMLYDNAQLTVALLEAYAITGNARYAQVARETLDYLRREMRSPEGAFYSATDADSPVPGKQEHEEGWFFTWTPAELETVLGAELATKVSAYYGVSARGNFEGRTILHTWREDQVVAAELGVEVGELNAELKRARGLLYDARLKRPPPLRDDKVLAAWNGLVLSAYSQAARTLDDEAYLDDARELGMFLATTMVKEQRLHRSYKAGTLGGRGFLDDYAFVIQGLLDLHEASSEPRWLDAAINLQAQLDAHFADPKGGYFTTADDGEVLLSRQKPGYDGAEPSGNSVAALNLLRLHALTLDQAYLETARRVFLAFAQPLARGGQGLPRMLVALDFFHDRPLQVLVVDAPNDVEGSARLKRAWRQTFSPNKVSAFVPVGEVALRAKQLPGVAEKLALKGLSTAYVCEGMVCQKPTSDPVLFAEQLSRVIAYDKSAHE